MSSGLGTSWDPPGGAGKHGWDARMIDGWMK